MATKKFTVDGGPAREELFDCLRLANRHNRLLPVEFRVQEVDYPLILKGVHSLERSGNLHAHDCHDWIIRSQDAHIVSYFQSPDDPDSWSSNYRVKIVYNTKTRKGTAYITRVRSKQ